MFRPYIRDCTFKSYFTMPPVIEDHIEYSDGISLAWASHFQIAIASLRLCGSMASLISGMPEGSQQHQLSQAQFIAVPQHTHLFRHHALSVDKGAIRAP